MSINSSRRPDEGRAANPRATSKRAEIKKAVPIEIGTASYGLLLVFGPAFVLRLFFYSVAVRAAFVSIVPDNGLAK